MRHDNWNPLAKSGWALLAMTSLACGGSGPAQGGDVAPEGPPSPELTEQNLGVAPRDLRVLPYDTRGSLQAKRTLVDDSYAELPLRAQGGRLSVHAEGETLVVERALINLDDVVLDESRLPPDGLTLTNLRMELQTPMRGTLRWFGGGTEGDAQLSGDFLLKGTLRTKAGDEAPFLSQRFDQVPVFAAMSQDSVGNLVARFTCARDGVTWSWGGLTQTGRFELEGRAIEDPVGLGR